MAASVSKLMMTNLKSKTDNMQHFGKFKLKCFWCHKFDYYHSKHHTRMSNTKEKGEKSNFVEEEGSKNVVDDG